MTITDSLFENNTADKGGAIYNTGTLHFAGTNTFKGNNATEGNDIYNVGSVTVESGVTRPEQRVYPGKRLAGGE